jgi:hypothetical protein
MARTRSLRPAAKKPSVSGQVEAMVRTLGRPEPGLLDAALEGVDAKRAMDRALVHPTDKLIEQAFALCLEAHAVWQRCSAAQRAHLRGFSLPLLGLAAEQAMALDRHHADYERLESERVDAGSRLRDLFDRNVVLSNQARMVLEKVNGEAAAVREELALQEPPGNSFALAQALHRVAHIGYALLRSASPTVRGRAKLYGLDEAFLDSLAAAGAELVNLEEKAGDATAVQAKKSQLDRAQVATFVLVRQIAEAFEAAQQIDQKIGPLPPIAHRTDDAARATQVSPQRQRPTPTVGTAGTVAAGGYVPTKIVSPAPPLRVVEPDPHGDTRLSRTVRS